MPPMFAVPALAVAALLLAPLPHAAAAEEKAQAQEAAEPETGGAQANLEAALKKLDLPGVKIHPDKWCVDVECRVCLREGLLELIACTQDTKEHESIIKVEAKPSHIHVALLLLGARPGNPAMRMAIDPEMTRFTDVRPRGDLVDVFLVTKDDKGVETERPISDFIRRAADHQGGHSDPGPDDPPDPDGQDDRKFPTHSFVFAGSILPEAEEGARPYVADFSGNVISVATFGDELLCLPGIHDHANEALVWEVNGKHLPALNAKVTLRLRPKVDRRPLNGP